MMIVKDSGEWNATYESGESPLRKERRTKHFLWLQLLSLIFIHTVSLFFLFKLTF